MSDIGLDTTKLPPETRAKLAELELELSEGKCVSLDDDDDDDDM